MKEVLELVGGKVRVKEKKRSKYRNVPVKDPVDGYFHSGSEHTQWKTLQLQQRAGIICQLSRQVPFPLTVNGILVATYIADYVYHLGPQPFSLADRPVVEDRKGGKAKTAAAQVFEIKRKLMKACYGIDILITGKNT